MSEITLEKIDIVRERAGVSYQEAKDCLEKAEGNVVDALIIIEKKGEEKTKQYKISKDEMLNSVKKVLDKGNVTKIVVKKDDEKYFEVPVSVGISAAFVMGIISPLFIWAGILVGSITSISIEIIKEDGSVEIVNKIFQSLGNDIKTKATEKAAEIREKTEEVKEEVIFKVGETSENIKTKATEIKDTVLIKKDILMDKVNGKIDTMKNSAQDKSLEITDDLKEDVSDATDTAKAKTDNILNKAKELGDNVLDKVKSSLKKDNIKKEENSFTYTVDFDDEKIKYKEDENK